MKKPVSRKAFNGILCIVSGAVTIVGNHLIRSNRTGYLIFIIFFFLFLGAIDLFFTLTVRVKSTDHYKRDFLLSMLLFLAVFAAFSLLNLI